MQPNMVFRLALKYISDVKPGQKLSGSNPVCRSVRGCPSESIRAVVTCPSTIVWSPRFSTEPQCSHSKAASASARYGALFIRMRAGVILADALVTAQNLFRYCPLAGSQYAHGERGAGPEEVHQGAASRQRDRQGRRFEVYLCHPRTKQRGLLVVSRRRDDTGAIAQRSQRLLHQLLSHGLLIRSLDQYVLAPWLILLWRSGL